MTKICKECFMKQSNIDEAQFEKGLRERRIPKWNQTQTGRIPACVKCGKEGEVYG